MGESQVRSQQHIAYGAADTALRAGLQKAEELGIRVAICITDAHGDVVAVARMDGAPGQAWEGAKGKAVFAASIGRPTGEFIEQRLKHNEALWRAMAANPDVFIVEGGYPFIHDGAPVGGVGVSGSKHEQDAQVAQAAMDAFAAQEPTGQ